MAEDLIGKFLVRRMPQGVARLMISETEAYDGPKDLASHARFGRTARTEPMFAGPGTIYVYQIYGLHLMLNIVCGKRGYPAAVLLRSAGSITGPGRLARELAINKELSGLKLGRGTGLWIEDPGMTGERGYILKTPRIGVGYAGPYAEKPWRFVRG